MGDVIQLSDFTEVRSEPDPNVRQPPSWLSMQGFKLIVDPDELLKAFPPRGMKMFREFYGLFRGRIVPIVEKFNGKWGPPLWDALEEEGEKTLAFLKEARSED